MVGLIEAGSISGKFAKEFPPELLKKGGSPAALVEARGLGMISDPATIAAIVDELLAAHPAEVEAFRGGKADPKLANRILAEQLKG